MPQLLARPHGHLRVASTAVPRSRQTTQRKDQKRGRARVAVQAVDPRSTLPPSLGKAIAEARRCRRPMSSLAFITRPLVAPKHPRYDLVDHDRVEIRQRNESTLQTLARQVLLAAQRVARSRRLNNPPAQTMHAPWASGCTT